MGSIFKDFFDQGKDRESSGEVIYANDPSENISEQKIRADISGRVQGVGFRFSTKQTADELGIKGIVRNEPDGTVHVEAMGDREQLSRFIEALRKGPSPAAQVEKVVVTYDENIEEKSNFSQAN
ncbi:acylphosphatase [Alkalibacterium subtropicum]|uniref:acylphosphatase n=1 Tax=Alkalibacterium subtropicum TaxID=753702 RepID=A0A1I1GP36_9LACT|nr:acylphosphatase [Alkalibacterium subtropicum]SFC13517.1 acylphosphatase [Alkalibacterium subtropicum]